MKFAHASDSKVDSIYGAYLDLSAAAIEAFQRRSVPNENLAAKLLFPDRIIRVHWTGRIEVEPR